MRALGLAFAVFALVGLLSACGPVHSVTLGRGQHGVDHHDHHGHHGPPAHAPAHGHRRKYGHHRHHEGHHHRTGVNLEFDSGLGVYVVVDVPNHYYWDGWYLKIEDGHWFASTRLSGASWSPREHAKLPPGLARKHPGKRGKGPGRSAEHPGKGKGKGKGKGPAKNDW
jgi:hypothetical protein